jgi:hypothetical protein
LKGRRFRVVQNVKARGHHFHFPARNFEIGFLAAQDPAFERDDEFRAKFFSLFVRFGMKLLVEDDLYNPGAVSQINKNQLAKIATAVDPAH